MTSARLTVTPSFVMSGSIVAGTARHRLDSMTTELEVEADADTDTVAAMVDQAERMCFVLDAIESTHDVTRSATVNGESI
ncbi:MAG: hypothetical protein AAFN30_18315 [Actinomycetota bacterium]